MPKQPKDTYVVDPVHACLSKAKVLIEMHRCLLKRAGNAQVSQHSSLRRALRQLPLPDGMAALGEGIPRCIRNLKHWLPTYNMAGTNRCAAIVGGAMELRGKQLGQMGAREYKQWVDKALLKAGVAHRWTRESPKAPPLPTVVRREETPPL